MFPVQIEAPSSKSLSHRMLIAAALADGVSHLSHVLESDDTARTREALSALGARFERTGPGCFSVSGLAGKVRAPIAEDSAGSGALSVFVGESGTTCRLLTAVLAAGQGRFRVHGAGRMHTRPIRELAEALAGLGARFFFEQRDGCPPFLLEASGLRPAVGLPGCQPDVQSGVQSGVRTGRACPAAARHEGKEDGDVSIGCDESSQYLSGLLLAAPLGQGLRIVLGGRRVVSWPYVSLTLETLERFGLVPVVETPGPEGWEAVDWRTLHEARPGGVRFCIAPGSYRPQTLAVEGDWSGASYFLAAGAIGPRPVRVLGLNPCSLQGDAAMLALLRAMGARVEWDDRGVTVFPSALRGIEADLGPCPDLAPTVAALAAHAEGETRISGAAHLKIKESDRLAAPATELRKAGCEVSLERDGMLIRPPQGGPRALRPGEVFSAHGDHRMAMSLSLLGLPGQKGAPGFAVPLDDPACVAKSFPHFWELWAKVRDAEQGLI